MTNQKQSLSAPPPQTQGPKDPQKDYTKTKQEFEQAFKDFHQTHFKSKVLDENKSAAVKKTEKMAVDRLIRAVISLNEANVGEGSMAFDILLIHELLDSRDRANQLEYEQCKLQRDMLLLKKELGIDDGQAKK
jgi:hypothetical protein